MSAVDAIGWLLPACVALSAGLVWGTIRYARRRGLIDLPGQRRSHSAPTPRGGGLGIVLTLVGGLCLAAAVGDLEWAGLWVLAPLVLVAGIGFCDDHRPLPALPRLAVHVLAASLLAYGAPPPALDPLPAALVLMVVVFGLAALVNVWNFMDGINGLASVHALWIACVAGALSFAHGAASTGMLAGVLAAAILGFLPFNLPRARIFLGDIGSGFLGIAVGALLLLAWREGNLGLPALVLLPSAFLIDAGATLVLRMAAGRRWYTAHRSHLYQWLARRGRSHSRIVLMSLVWNLHTTGLALYLGPRQDPMAVALAVKVLAVGLLGWVVLRMRLRREAAGSH